MRALLTQILSIANKNAIFLGVKKGLSVPLLPTKISSLYNHIYLRIFRFIGGVCLLLVLTSNYRHLPTFLHLIIIIVGAIHSIQMCVIFLIKACYGIYTLKYKPEDFEVRNSPLNHMASHIGKILYCAKVGCVVTGGAATFLGGGVVVDQILEEAGREKVFVPFMGSLYKSAFGELTPTTQERLNAMTTSATPNKDNKSAISETISKYESGEAGSGKSSLFRGN